MQFEIFISNKYFKNKISKLIKKLINTNFLISLFFVFKASRLEENGTIFVFESKKSAASTAHHHSRFVGFCEIGFAKEAFFHLCEFFLHSVYDSKSLEDFDLHGFLLQNLIERVEEAESEFDRFCSVSSGGNSFNYSSSLIKSEFIKSRFLIRADCGFVEDSGCETLTFDYIWLDRKLSNAFRLIDLPSDWTLLGQDCYLLQCKYFDFYNSYNDFCVEILQHS
jgi:hypothetical protein